MATDDSKAPLRTRVAVGRGTYMASATVEVEVVVRFRNGDTGKLVGRPGRAKCIMEMDADYPGTLNPGESQRQALAELIASHCTEPVGYFASLHGPLDKDDYEPIHDRWILANWLAVFGVKWDAAWASIDRGVVKEAHTAIRRQRTRAALRPDVE